MKISRNKLTSMIQESIRKCMLNESIVYASKTYSPYDREILSAEEYENLPQELLNIYENDYEISFTGNSWYYRGSGEWMYSLGEPEDWGVDDIQLSDDDGFSSDIQTIEGTYPEFAQALKNDFDNWCDEQGENSLEFRVDDD